MRNTNFALVNAVSASASVTSAKLDANQLIASSFQFIFSDAAATGTVKIQASNDPCGYGNLALDFTPTNWVDIPTQSGSVTAGASVLLTISQCCYRWLRIIYTRSAGAGTITVNVDALGF